VWRWTPLHTFLTPFSGPAFPFSRTADRLPSMLEFGGSREHPVFLYSFVRVGSGPRNPPSASSVTSPFLPVLHRTPLFLRALYPRPGFYCPQLLLGLFLAPSSPCLSVQEGQKARPESTMRAPLFLSTISVACPLPRSLEGIRRRRTTSFPRFLDLWPTNAIAETTPPPFKLHKTT